jgi:4-aminobutyrate--pyruvate transaminase
MTVAKQLSSAYLPIAGLLMRQEFYDVLAEQTQKLGMLGMGYTYGGHPVSAAVALETLKIYEETDMLGHVRAVAPRFQERLARLGEHPLVGEARGVGLIGAIEIVADKTTRAQYPAAAKAAAAIATNCLQHGLILRPLPGDVVGICPPLIIKEAEIDLLFDRLEQALNDTLPAMHQAA